MQTNVLEYLEHTALRVPDRLAFADDEMGLTFRDVHSCARRVGSSLAGEGAFREPVVV